MSSFSVRTIGSISVSENETFIRLDKEYIPALTGLDGFGYVQVLWWFDGCDNEGSRSKLRETSPYKNAPELLGTFATRSPERPNPIALTAAYVTYIDYENGIIGLSYIDALDGSPVLDIKPYTPSLRNPLFPNGAENGPAQLSSRETLTGHLYSISNFR